MTMADANDISDGFHTFGELYAHRRALTAVLAGLIPGSYRTKEHHPEDSTILEGRFLVCIPTPAGPITYHYPLEHWSEFSAIPALEHAARWDGATADDTVTRLLSWAGAL